MAMRDLPSAALGADDHKEEGKPEPVLGSVLAVGFMGDSYHAFVPLFLRASCLGNLGEPQARRGKHPLG